MSNELTLTVSRPPPALRSNGGHGNHWAVSKARAAAKSEAWIETLMSRGLKVAAGDVVNIQFTELLGPRERAMDDDNLTGAMKPYRDGIAGALGINDKIMLTQPRRPAERGPKSGVRVRLWVEPLPPTSQEGQGGPIGHL